MGEPLPGNRAVRRRLAALAAAGRLHPTILLEGPEGVGKAELAWWLAALLACQERPLARDGVDAEPCGRCWGCRRVTAREHPDMVHVVPDPEKATRVITVERAREVVAEVQTRPQHAAARLVVVDPADALGSGAANALLKTLEEPPPGTHFVLLTSAPWRLLPTVRSRAWRVRLSVVPADEIAAWLRGRGVEDAEAVAALADGRPRRALELAEGEAEAWREAREKLLSALGGRIGGVFAFNQELAKGNRDRWTPRVERVLDALERLLRDAWVLAAGADLPLYDEDLRPVLERWAAVLGAGGTARLQRALEEARDQLEANAQPRIVLDALLLRVATELGAARKGAARKGAARTGGARKGRARGAGATGGGP